jgi:hypothetical protein
VCGRRSGFPRVIATPLAELGLSGYRGEDVRQFDENYSLPSVYSLLTPIEFRAALAASGWRAGSESGVKK